MISVNSIEIPARFVRVAGEWYSGMGDMLYAVCSTGGLTTGTNCPVSDYMNRRDRDEKWYLTIWRNLSCDVGRAESAARKQLVDYGDPPEFEDWDDSEYLELVKDVEDLQDFENWVDNTVISDLEEDYGLVDWEN